MNQSLTRQGFQPAIEHISRKQYDAINLYLQMSVAAYSQNAYIVQTVVNQVLVKLATLNEPIADIEGWAQQALPRAIETCFNDLRMYAYKYALQITQREEVAEDIAQDALILMIKNVNNITYIKGWLRVTTHNLAIKTFQEKYKDTAMLQQLIQSRQSLAQDTDPDAEKLVDALSQDDVKQMLSKKDFLMYRKMKSFENLKAYATVSQISYQTAREHSLHIRTNLKSAIVLKEGWTSSPTILNYSNLHNIKLFTHKLIDYYVRGKLSQLRQCHSNLNKADMENELRDFTQIMDWGITSLGGNEYRISIFDKAIKPIFALLYISINRANRIILHKVVRKEVDLIIPNPNAVNIPVRKGRIPLSIEDIQALVSYKEPYTYKDK